MWKNSAVSNYGDINYSINQAYCIKRGYDLIGSSRLLHKTRI
jgi:hypothetical protein